MIRVLVAYGSKRNGTAEIAEWVATTLRENGTDAHARDAARITDVAGYDAVIVGGALYAGRWHRAIRRFLRANARQLVHLPVWAFSSGPLDRTAETGTVEPSPWVAKALARIGAQSHATFGGRLEADASGFVASKLAKAHGGDYRNKDQIEGWAREIARELAAIAA